MNNEEIKSFMAIVDPTIRWEAKHTYFNNKFIRSSYSEPNKNDCIEKIYNSLWCSTTVAILKQETMPLYPKAWTKAVLNNAIITSAREMKNKKNNYGIKPLTLDSYKTMGTEGEDKILLADTIEKNYHLHDTSTDVYSLNTTQTIVARVLEEGNRGEEARKELNTKYGVDLSKKQFRTLREITKEQIESIAEKNKLLEPKKQK